MPRALSENEKAPAMTGASLGAERKERLVKLTGDATERRVQLGPSPLSETVLQPKRNIIVRLLTGLFPVLSLGQAARLSTIWLLFLALIISIALRSIQSLGAGRTFAAPSYALEPLTIVLRETTP